MNDIFRFARRMLEAFRVGTTDKVYPGYLAFHLGERPSWWKDGTEGTNHGDVIGVHESGAGERDGSIVVTSTGLAILSKALVQWLPYEHFDTFEQPSKEPIAKSLRIRATNGERIQLHFERGGAFAFVQFLSGAKRRVQAARKKSL